MSSFPEQAPILPKTGRAKYDYVGGLAELAQKMVKPVGLDVGSSAFGTHCEFCGAAIHNLYLFHDDAGFEITIGSECAGKLSKYLEMPAGMVERAIKYFDQYRALAREAKVSPAARIALKDLEKKIVEMRELAEAEKERKFQTESAPQREILNKVYQLRNSGIFSQWEIGFISSVKSQLDFRILSAKQMEILTKMAERAKDPAALVQVQVKEKQREADHAQLRLLNSQKLSYFDRPFVNSLWDWVVGGQPLTENQKKAVEKMLVKYAKQIEEYKKEYPNWAEWA